MPQVFQGTTGLCSYPWFAHRPSILCLWVWWEAGGNFLFSEWNLKVRVKEVKNKIHVQLLFPFQLALHYFRPNERDLWQADLPWFRVCGGACVHTRVTVGIREGACFPTASQGKALLSSEWNMWCWSGSGARATIWMSVYGSICCCSEDLLPGVRLPNHPNHMFSSAVIPTSPSLLGGGILDPRPASQPGWAQVVLGFDNPGEGRGCFIILISETIGIKTNVKFTSDPR